jgi:hypothetical protein
MGMSAPGDVAVQDKVDFHHLLLRLAGKVPDGLVAQARAWLAADRVDEAVRAVTFTALAQRVPLFEEDVALLRELMEDRDADSSMLSGVEIAQYDPAPPFGFGASPPGTPAPVRPSDAPLDDVDTAAVAAVAEELGLRGLWRAWRFPVDGSPWPPARKVYLVEAGPDVDVVALSGRIQQRLTSAGEADPQVETYLSDAVSDTELPTYQRLAIAYGSLLWASTPEPDIKIASIFDEVDPQVGPLFTDAHDRMDDAEEAQRVIDYLNAGQPLLVTTAAMDDVVDRSRHNVVPMKFRPDGTWIWTDTTTYYLERHNLAPDPELLGHIRAADYRMPEIDGVAIHRTMAVLQEPPEEEPVWTYDGSSSGRPTVADDALADEDDDDEDDEDDEDDDAEN